MGGGVRGWAVVVADGADACKEKTKQNKKIKRRKNLLVDLECGWMWTWTDVDTDGCGVNTVARLMTQHVYKCVWT